jgi:hypothetical protein
MMDATPTSRLCEYVCEKLHEVSSAPTVEFDRSTLLSKPPTQIHFNISNSIKLHIKEAKKNFEALVYNLISIYIKK